MKKLLKLVLSSWLTLFLFQNVNSQSSTVGHIGIAPAISWCGYTNNALPFHLEHRGTQDINFLTGTVQRMTIKGTAYSNPGFVGIGNGFTAPESMLHLHDGFASSFQMTNATTGSVASDGFRIFQFFSQLRLGQQEANDMFFHTGGAIALANERMVITGIPGATQGFIGMGTNFTTPQSILNISAFNNATGNIFRSDGSNAIDNNWAMFTGPSTAFLTQRGRVFAPATSLNFSVEGSTGGVEILAAGGNSFLGTIPNPVLQRMIVSNGDYLNSTGALIAANVTRVGISYGDGILPISQPLSLLHLGYGNNPGYRNWMDVGMYIAKFDNMYIGLKEEASNRLDAVINWGDDGIAAGPDNLRFIFTGVSGPIAAGAFDGFETGRITPFANWGVGNFFNDPLFPFGNPVRRMEILSDKPVATANGNPQLRLTNFQQDPTNVATTGRYAEFHSLQNGDLTISASDNTQANTAAQILKERFVGINTITPGNTVEINSQYVSPATPNGQPLVTATSPAPTGWAGLRFSDLNSNSITQSNPGVGVLAVDANGDVIYAPSGGGFGNLCTTPPAPANPLPADWEIPLNSFNYLFSGQGITGTHSVMIGQPCGTIPTAKFEVLQQSGSSQSITGLFSSNDIEARVIFAKTAAPIPAAGAFSAAGVFAGSNINKTQAIVVPFSGGNVGFGTVTPNTSYRLEVIGDANFNGTVFTTTGTISVSDSTFKQNVNDLTNARSIVNQLAPKTFFFDTTNVAGINFPRELQYGFIAQDVESILPALVLVKTKTAEYDIDGTLLHPAATFKTLNYTGIIPILTKALSEQDSLIGDLTDNLNEQDSINAQLQDQIDQLTNLINSCCENRTSIQTQQQNQNNSSISSHNIELQDEQSVVLEQNVPNPFAEQTTISYFLPENILRAQMLFYNNQGRLIQSVDLAGKGKGSLTVFASDLSNGIYTYTLVVDGKVIETKKMAKQ